MTAADMTEAPSQATPARSRFERAGKEERGGLVLTERDADLLTDLFVHGLMDRGQIQELYFGSVPRCNMRLRQLFDHGYVSRAFSPFAPYGSQALYRAGRAAAGVIAGRLDLDAAEVRKQCRTGADAPQFVEHTLAVVDLYLRLRRAAAASAGAVQIEIWLPEMLARHEYEMRPAVAGQATSGRGWRRQVFKPDAFFRLRRNGGTGGAARHSCFVEVDRGHTSSAKFAEKLASHWRYLESGLFEETYGAEADGFRTLVVTTGQRRLGHLVEVVERAGPALRPSPAPPTLFWFTTFAALAEASPLAPVWRVPGSEGLHRLTGEGV